MEQENKSSDCGNAKDLQVYFDSIKNHPLITREEEVEFGRQYKQTGKIRYRDKLIVANLRFVVKTAMKYSGYGFDVMDMVQEGNRGLIWATEKWDPDKGNRLISYAVWYIHAYIREYILNNWSLVKIGTNQDERRIFHRLMSSVWSNKDSESILANTHNSSLEDLERFKHRVSARELSLDGVIGNSGDGSTLHEVLPDNATCQDEALEQLDSERFFSLAVKRAMKSLSGRDKIIIRGRYLDSEMKTLRQIGGDVGLSQERVRQLEMSALERMSEFFTQEQNTEMAEELRDMLGNNVIRNIKRPPLIKMPAHRADSIVEIEISSATDQPAIEKLADLSGMQHALVGVLKTLGMGSELAEKAEKTLLLLRQIQGGKEG